MKEVGLVLEGGGFRGLFTSGVLDVFLENNIDISEIIGVSAGALFGVNYFSKQKGRTIRYNKKYCGDSRYMGLKSLILTGNYVNKDFAYFKVSKELDPFDNDQFIESKKHFFAVVTNVETGEPEYLEVKSPLDDLEILRASSSIPLVSQMVEINGNKYMDGAIADSIPIHFNINKYEKNIVILTQPLGYQKPPLKKVKERFVKIKFRKYPEFVKAILNRYQKYNKVLDEIHKLEQEGKIFVIRPPKSIHVKLNEINEEKMQEIYDLGIETGKSIINDLLVYLKK